MALNISIIQAESELADVSGKMLVAGVVVDAMQPAFQDSPHTFDAVGRYTPSVVFPGSVIDLLMLIQQAAQGVIPAMFIRVER